MEKILISGASSGLGKYLHENLPSIPLTRETSKLDFERLKKSGVDLIIHCAANSSKDITSENIYSYIEDNIELTRKLTNIPHKKFIFISTVDVYPDDGLVHSEEEVLNLEKAINLYAVSKIISESIIRNNSKNHLILRCCSLLGKYMRKNNLIKILDEENPKLSLDPNSEFSYILYSDILEIVKSSLKDQEKAKGTFNTVSSGHLKLSEVASLTNKNVTFGKFLYKAARVNNSKILEIFPEFKISSIEKLKKFISERKNG